MSLQAFPSPRRPWARVDSEDSDITSFKSARTWHGFLPYVAQTFQTECKVYSTWTLHPDAMFRRRPQKNKYFELNKYFKLKNSRGAGAPLNSNYLLTTSLCMFNSSDGWVCSIAAGVKDTSWCHRLGQQEFQVSRPGSHPVKAPLQKLSKCFADAF